MQINLACINSQTDSLKPDLKFKLTTLAKPEA